MNLGVNSVNWGGLEGIYMIGLDWGELGVSKWFELDKLCQDRLNWIELGCIVMNWIEWRGIDWGK